MQVAGAHRVGRPARGGVRAGIGSGKLRRHALAGVGADHRAAFGDRQVRLYPLYGGVCEQKARTHEKIHGRAARAGRGRGDLPARHFRAEYVRDDVRGASDAGYDFC